MQHADFAPLYRSTVGFDRLIQMLDATTRFEPDDGYPPYNIERLNENEYRITMAVAGFSAHELSIEAREQTLVVKAQKTNEPAAAVKPSYLHRGIGTRSFERRFQLADHVEVKAADLQDGLLHIALVRNLPERMKPRQIAIGTGDSVALGVKQIETKSAD